MENTENNLYIKKTTKEYMDKFYNMHPDLKIKKYICAECGLEYSYFNKSKHYKQKNHLNIVKRINELINKKTP